MRECVGLGKEKRFDKGRHTTHRLRPQNIVSYKNSPDSCNFVYAIGRLAFACWHVYRISHGLAANAERRGAHRVRWRGVACPIYR